MQLPLYQCHKQVRAAKIIAITPISANGAGAELVLDIPDPACPNQGHVSVFVDKPWFTRNPAVAVGGYFVEYQEGDKYTAYSPAAPFESGYTPIQMSNGTISVMEIARCCHEANRSLCASLGDYSQLPWEAAPDWQRKSAFTGVLFNLDYPDAPASASHDSWLAEKQATGWKFGPVKDAEKKEHPCFVPYEELPKEQQAKDHLFKAVVAALAPFLTLPDANCNCSMQEGTNACSSCSTT